MDQKQLLALMVAVIYASDPYKYDRGSNAGAIDAALDGASAILKRLEATNETQN